MLFRNKRAVPIAGGIDPTLEHIISKCGGKLENTIRYILTAAERQEICAICVWASTLPPVKRLQEWLTPDPEGGEEE